MVAGGGAITHAVDHNKGQGKDGDDAEAQDAETRVEDDAAACSDGNAGDSSTASTLAPFSEPPQATDATGYGTRAEAAGNAIGGQSQAQLGSLTASQLLTATKATVQKAEPTTVIPVPQGQTVTVPPGSTITLGNGTTMHVNSGSVTVVGAGASTRVGNVPVTINGGSTVNTLSRCCAGGTVIPADTRLTTTSSPIALTQYRHAKVEVQLISGSATTNTATHIGEVITHARESATATVGAAGASITNTKGTVTITSGQYP